MTRYQAWLAKLPTGKILSRGRTLAAHYSPLAQRRKRQLQMSLAELGRVVAELEKVSARLEAEFLTTATALMELDSRGADFVKQSGHLINIAIGQSGGNEVFTEAMQVILPPLDFLNDSHAATNKLVERLEQDNERIANLIKGRDDLKTTMAPLKYIQTSFKIEAAPLGAEVQMMFTALTQEIDKLHTQVCDVFTIKYEELQQVQQTIGQVIGRLAASSKVMAEKIACEKTQINDTVSHLQNELQDNQKRESSIAGLSGAVATEIQQVVFALQFQDIISQRIQHAIAALAKVKAQYDGSVHSVDYMEQACRLEAQQIKAIRAELAKAEAAVKGGIESVLARLAEADERCVSLKEFESLTVSANGMVQVLLDVLALLQKQTKDTEAGCASALEILNPIGSMASDLTQVVRGLSSRIHLIGLNAQVQAAQVPEGMGLEVLSARTSEISRETNRISQSIAGQLDHLVAGLVQSLAALGEIHSTAATQNVTLDECGGRSEAKLHALRDGALTSLAEVNRLLEVIRVQGRTVLDSVNYVRIGDDALARLEQQLEAVAAIASHQLGKHHTSSLELVADLKAGYTMASERAVFEGAADMATEAEAEPSWEREPATAAPTPAAATASASSVELF